MEKRIRQQRANHSQKQKKKKKTFGISLHGHAATVETLCAAFTSGAKDLE